MNEVSKSNELRRVSKKLIQTEKFLDKQIFRAVTFKSKGKEYQAELTIRKM